jgi:hypothetical protein
VVITGRHRPHELLLLAVSIPIGLSYVFGAPPPGSVAALIPAWEVRIWAWLLLFSGLVGLVSSSWGRDARFALRLEAGAMLLGAGALLIYTVAVFQLGTWRGLFAGGITVAWMAANLWRALQIRRDLREM